MKEPNDIHAIKKRLAQLSPARRRELLEKLQAAKSPDSSEKASEIEKAQPIAIEHTKDENGNELEIRKYRASLSQERMWFLDQFFGDAPVYSSPMAFHLQGELNVKALQDSFNVLVARHTALRSNFEGTPEGMVQLVRSSASLSLIHKDLNGSLDAKREAAKQYVSEEACRPFDLENDLPIRVHLVYIDLEEVVLLIVVHHIIADGWTRSNLCKELSDTYRKILGGAKLKSESADLQIEDYSHWQRQSMKGKDFDRHLSYWENKLAGDLPVLELPVDFPRSGRVSSSGDSLVIEIGNELVEEIRKVAQGNGVTLFMFGLAAFKMLMRHYSGQEELIVGMPIGNRSKPELESMLGCFINTLAIRTHAHGDPSFIQFLEDVKDVCVEAYEHQELPFESIIEQIDFDRSQGRSPIFQSIFALQDFPEVSIEIDNVFCSEWFVRTFTSKVEIYLNLEQQNGQWVSVIEYNSDLYSAASIARLSRHWKKLLEEICMNPEQTVSELTRGSEPEAEMIERTTAEGAAIVDDSKLAENPDVERVDLLDFLRDSFDEALGDNGFGNEDSFFDIGGNSLLANLVLLKLHNTFGWNVSLREFFENPSVSEFKDHIQRTQRLPTSQSIPIERGDALVLSDDEKVTKKGFNCYVIGQGRMMVEATHAMREKGMEVLGIFSKDPFVQEWAKKNEIKYACLDDELESFLSSEPFDYLFSVVNPIVLSPKVISLARKGAFNWHDSPLPRYGGINAPYWGLINGETSWAVTWHKLEEGIDTGPIFKQVPVEITSADTFLSLGLRCVEAGVEGLKELIDELYEDRVVERPQNLAERTYFSKIKRASVAGILDWKKTAGELMTEYRALDLGPLYNSIQSLKVLIGDSVYIVSQMSLSDRNEDAPGGTILQLTSESIVVRAATGSVSIEGIKTSLGLSISLADLIRKEGLQEGDPLRCLSDSESKTLEGLERKSILQETYCRNRWSDLRPVSFAGGIELDEKEGCDYQVLPLDLDEDLQSRLSTPSFKEVLAAVWAGFIGRTTNEREFDIERIDLTGTEGTSLDASLYSKYTPWRISGALGKTVSEFVKEIRDSFDQNQEPSCIAYDLVVRDPGLEHMQRANKFNKVPLGLVFSDKERLSKSPLDFHSFLRVGNPEDLDVVFDRSIISEPHAATLRSVFICFLRNCLEQRDLKLANISLLDEKENARLIELGRGATLDDSELLPVHLQFEQRVKEQPNAIAVEEGNTAISFDELNKRANQLAHYLVGKGVCADVCVGIYLGRSIDTIVSILAILKAGGAYVPLDTAYPEKRLEQMVLDSRLSLVISKSDTKSGFLRSVDVVCIHELLAEEFDISEVGNPDINTKLDDLAYVIFTSGSTGNPKGVQIEHQSVSNYISFANDEYSLDETDRILQFASLNFDSSVEEIFCSLTSGATLVLRSDDAIAGFSGFVDFCEEKEISILPLPTAFWHSWVSHSKEGEFRIPQSVKSIVLGGEAIIPAILSQWFNQVGDRIRLFNSYGPTEATVVAACTELFDTKDWDSGLEIRIGKIIQNCEAYVLDDAQNILPIGFVGELYLGGIGLARGYLNQPEETANRFIGHPFDESPGARLYRTGDLVKQHEDGVLSYVGRKDEQLKVRGYRLEPKEIEAKLINLSGIRECAVTTSNDETKAKVLLGFIVPSDLDKVPDSKEIRSSLKQQLPEFMIPQRFLFLKELPYTPNGKVDRKNLHKASTLRSPAVTSELTDRTEKERAMAEIWCQVLDLEEIGIEDNFFEMGGHSLLGTQLISRIRNQLSLGVNIGDLFECPTIKSLLSKLSPDQVEEPILPTAGESYELSFAQKRLWFIDQFKGGSAEYNVSTMLAFKGQVDHLSLLRSINAIIARHESLRTYFKEEFGEPIQVVVPQLEIDLPLVDLGKLEKREQSERIARESAELFSLDKLPLIRGKLYRVSDDISILSVVIHHIVSDGWSTGVFYRELSTCYNAFKKGRKPALFPLPIQYADYAHWQRQWLQGDVLEKQLDYWKNTLKGLEVLEFPTDRARPALQTHNGALCYFKLPSSLSEELATYMKARRITPFMFFLTAFQTLLGRYSNQDDIAVGTPIANRQKEEQEALIGFFVNTLVMRLELLDHSSFDDLIQQMRAKILDSFMAQDLPFERLVEAINPSRDPSRHPLFQILFALQNAGGKAPRFEGLELVDFPRSTSFTHFDLELHVSNDQGEWAGYLVYNTDLFDKQTIESFSDHYQNLLVAVVRNPQLPVKEIEFLGENEKQALLDLCKAKSIERIELPFVCDLVDQIADAHPGQCAVQYEDAELDYSELKRWSGQLANRLKDLGVAANDPVAVFCDRSIEAIIAILAVIKSGAACMPMDPSYPAARLEGMIEDADPKIILTQNRLKDLLPLNKANLLLVDTEDSTGEYQKHRTAVNDPDDIAYILYTSGSTGKPKGVQVPHRTLSNLIDWQRKESSCSVGDRTFQFAAFNFDVSFQEIFSTLATGGILSIVPEGSRKDSALFAKMIEAENPKRIFLPFVALDVLARSSVLENKVLALKEVITAGEQLKITPAIRSFFSHLKDGVLFNHYGPTETHVVTSYALTGDSNEWPGLPPIGHPIQHVNLYIVDPQGKPVPIGVVGELLVGGTPVALGYIKDASMTSQKFIASPWIAGDRLYKTGDLVRYRRDGSIEFLGRADDQVKIRGFRVELGEIENRLNQHPSIDEAVVTVLDETSFNKQLVAYLVSSLADEDVSEIKKHVAEMLPDYMVPSCFVFLEAFPLSPNKKINKRALPKPDLGRSQVSDSYKAPSTSLETALSDIWARILEVRRVGVQDNFFEFGGHSLLASQLLGRVRKELNVEISLQEFFEKPNVEALACIIQSRGDESLLSTHEDKGKAKVERYPLSFQQQRLWFVDTYQEGSPEYNIFRAYRFDGALDVALLEKSFKDLICHQDSLRTSIVSENGKAYQEVATTVETFELPVIDLTHLPISERDKIIAKDERHVFDLSKGPLIQAKLFIIGENTYTLTVVIHHIISDGISISILQNQLSEIYNARVRGEEVKLAKPEFTYAQYSCEQQSDFAKEENQKGLAYWTRKLKDPTPLALPADFPRPAIRTSNGSIFKKEISKDLVEKLTKFCREENSTAFMVLLANYYHLLSRYSGQKDVLVGFPIANRLQPNVDNTIGFFVNTIVGRCEFSGDVSFRQLVNDSMADILESFEYQSIPFEKVVESVNPSRDQSRNSIFQTSFSVNQLNLELPEWEGVQIANYPSLSTTCHFDISMNISIKENDRVGIVNYNTDLFSEYTIERFFNHYLHLLSTSLSNPDTFIGDQSLLTAQEQKTILVDWQGKKEKYPQDRGIHHLFERQTQLSPHAMAVCVENEEISYGELDRRADEYAGYLISFGVGPESIVGICVPRSIELMVGLLAILKAGGAYLPIDPENPNERIQYIFDDSGIKHLVTTKALSGQFSEFEGEVIHIDENAIRTLDSLPSKEFKSSQAAYVIYTSGSTGKPKGTVIEHRSAVNLINTCTKHPKLDSSDVFLAIATVTFDISVYELFGPLSVGAILVILSEGLRGDGFAIKQVCEQKAVTAMHATPSMWSVLLDTGWKGSSRFKILSGGEACSPDLATKLYKESGEFWNLYGPTEATIISTADHVTQPEHVSIGRPVGNTKVFILDHCLKPAPIGVAGELYIGGDGLAREYLNRPELTEKSFISNAFEWLDEPRLYKTGDICSWTTDGKIQFHSRGDNQVKVRGYRIELGEIESQLLNHDSVSECAVVTKTEKNATILVAYIKGSSVQTPETEQALRAHLKSSLPAYMVPSRFQFVSDFARTSSGKLDRKQLPEFSVSTSSSSTPLPEDTSVEGKLAAIWAELLGIENPERDDNFFDLGGHSLIAFQVVLKIRTVLKVEINLKDLFEYPTIASLAEFIEGNISDGQLIEPAPVEEEADEEAGDNPESIVRVESLSYAQNRIWFLEQLEPGMLAYNLFEGIRIHGPFDPLVFRKCIQTIIERHEVYRTVFRLVDGEPMQMVCAPKQYHFPVVDLTHLNRERQEQEVSRYLEVESATPFDLQNDLLLRTTILVLSDEDHVLLLNQHHIATDGWSTGILWKEITTLYQAYKANKPSPLLPLKTTYANYAKEQKQRLRGEYWNRLLSYWKEELNEVRPLELPTDRPRPRKLGNEGGVEDMALDQALVKRLREYSSARGSTMHMTLLSVFQLLLARLSGQSDVVVGIPSVSRNDPEVEPLIGVFLSTLLIRGDISTNPSFDEFLGQIRMKSLEALDHGDMPFEMLVEELAPDRDLSRNPLFQVLVNSQEGAIGSSKSLEGLELTRIGRDNHQSKFDLTLYTRIGESEVRFHIVYNRDLYDGVRIQGMLEQFQALLIQIVEDPQRKVLEYSLITPRQRNLWPQAIQQLEVERQSSVVEQMLEWSMSQPEHPAIVMDGWTSSYSEFAEATLAIAAHLRSQGISEGQRVIVDMDRSFGCIASLFGVLSVGAVIVPFASELPLERKRQMFNQVKAQVVIGSSASGFPAWCTEEQISIRICVDDKSGRIEGGSQNGLSRDEVFVPSHDSPAYIFFTSGTTGEPKGILGRYAGLNHFINWQKTAFEILPEDRVSQLTSLSFDVCLRDIFLPLSSGATLCLPSQSLLTISVEALDWLEEERVTVLHTVPSILKAWCHTETVDRILPDLKHTFSAGEPLQSDLVNHWRGVAKNSQIVNLYGPTETTLAKCYYQVPEHPREGVQPVGFSLPGVDVCILTKGNVEAGIGELGEIAIHTPYASLGYLDSESDTHSAFTEHPWKTTSNDPLYRTGDLGRLHPDGTIEIFGRIDDQIKIRGVRMEPKAIEHLLEDHPKVKHCRVIGIQDNAEEKMLVAYLVPLAEISQVELHEYLTTLLPPAMIPSAFVFIDEVPLTINGKLDTKALPKPEFSRESQDIEYVGPESELEIQLSDIFKELLNLEKVGIHDNFFHLGGNSLQIAKLSYYVQERIGKTLQVASVFKFPTISQLAKLLGDEDAVQNFSLLLTEEGTGDPIFFLPGIGRNALIHQDMAQRLDVDRPCYALEFPAPQKGVEPLKTVEELAGHCVEQITKIQPEGPYVVGGYSFAGIIAFEVARQLHARDGAYHRVFLFDARHRYEDESIAPHFQRFQWFKEMTKGYGLRFLTYFVKNLFLHHFLWKLGLWDGFNARPTGNLDHRLEGIPFIKSDSFHFQYRPTPFPVNMTVFTVKQFLFTRRGQAELRRWDNYITTEADYVLVNADTHLQILDEEHLDFICQRMRDDLAKDKNSEN